MDIFIFKTADAKNIDLELLNSFKKREFRNEDKFFEHSYSYLMADRILKNFYNIENREMELVNGKPFLKTREKYFGISHSGEYIALVFSDSDCSIDIEKIKERDYKAVSKRMGFNTHTLEEFYFAWTKYESEYKLSHGEKYTSQFKFEEYAVSVSSHNKSEKFELYIQNGNNFSNSEV